MPAGSSEPSGVLVHSSVLFTGIQGEILRRLNFCAEKHLASTAAGIILKHSRILPAEGDLLVPVPAGRSRSRERGYNQAALISRRLASLTGASSYEMLARKDGPSQVGLSFIERRKNVEGAFRLKRRKAVRKDVRIWVVDDVATTFSTIHSAATALLESGFEAVCGLTLAYRRKTAGSIIQAVTDNCGRERQWRRN